MEHDDYGDRVQAFVFRQAMQSGLTLTPTKKMLVHLGEDVSISLTGITVGFLKGTQMVLVKGATYTFSADIALGIS